ncbi:PilX N-terminal domain-containing pilus assembly protein [Vreelandella aquamarina]|uniref:pilus assembly PilX family protein n=1 Tax=Vreelandella aquamarina TaxID=77097 RepID=UPI003850F5E8
MPKQQGAALIIVLVLLSVSLMIGMSGMNVALVDERLAGNYRAAALAQMNAEIAASEASSDGSLDEATYWVSNANAVSSDLALSEWKEMVRDKSYIELKEDYPLGLVNEGVCDSGDNIYSRCLYFPVIRGELDHYVVAMGAVEDEAGKIIAESEPIFLKYEYGSSGDDSGVINEFLDNLKKNGGFITTFTEFDEDVVNANGNHAEKWVSYISNANQNGSMFESDEAFLNFINILKDSELVNFFSGTPSGKLSDYNGSIVVVDGDFEWKGNQGDFSGVLILLGKGESGFNYNGGGNNEIRGSILRIPYENVEGKVNFLEPNIRVNGGTGDFVFDTSVIDGLKGGGDGSGNSDGLLSLQRWEWE